MRKFGPFDTSVFYEVENRRLQRAFNPQTGFVKTGQGAVTAGTGAQLVIAAYPDGALVDGLYVENPDTEAVTVTANTGSTNPRIDRLVMRLDMNAKTIAPFQIVGTPAASPQAPPLVQTAAVYDMPLCRYTMPGSASAQNPGSIVDERIWSSAEWIPFTPVWTSSGSIQPGIGNGSLTGRYRSEGKTTKVSIALTFGSTTNGGSGSWSFGGFPAALASREQVVECKAFTAAGNLHGFGLLLGGATVTPYLPSTTSTQVMAPVRNADASAAAGTGIPTIAGTFPFANGHNLVLSGSYEAA